MKKTQTRKHMGGAVKNGSKAQPIYKILTLSELADISKKLRRNKKKLVLCHGVFDLLHNGHIRHLQRARDYGDALAVTLTADAYVNKGPGRPVFSEDLRAEAIAALSCVDYVAINQDTTAIAALKQIKPGVYAKGNDYRSAANDLTGKILFEKKAVQSGGGKIIYTDEITFSSSSILNEHFGVFPDETKRYLRLLRRRYSAGQVVEAVRKLKDMKVLVIGDAIIDEYHYTAPMGVTGKGNILAVKYDHKEQFAGGSLAAVNHVAGFVQGVTLVTGLGKREGYEAFIGSKLLKNIKKEFFHIPDASTVVKRRYIDADLAKLFEVYHFTDELLPASVDQKVCAWLKKNLRQYDLVVVPDFGNGFITPAMIKILCKQSRYLAVNTQINSGNRGYHVITRYRRADFISLNEPELRLACHNRHDPLNKIAFKLAQQIKASSFAVTRGTQGAMMLDVKTGVTHHVPALSTTVVDRIGAGDSFLSLASICLAGGIEPRLAAFIASATAALDVQIVCNREPVSATNLFKYITTLLK